MLATDFTGTYDYEKEEAHYAAQYLLDDLYDATLTPDEFDEKCLRELVHWKKCLDETFEDFERHFNDYVNRHREAAVIAYERKKAQ